MWKREASQSDLDCNLDYFLNEVVIAGDPEHVASQLVQLRERIGPFGSLVLVAHDWDNRRAGCAAWSYSPMRSFHASIPRSEPIQEQ